MSSNTDSLTLRTVALHDAPAPDTANSVLYIMSRDLRTIDNYALLAAQRHAIRSGLPLVVAFIGYTNPVANRAAEQAAFMIDGLSDVQAELNKSNIPFVLRSGKPKEVITQLAAELKPAAIYFDFNPLSGPRLLQKQVAANLNLPIYVVDAHNSVPVWIASPKLEVGARTLRPKLHRELPYFIAAEHHLVDHPHTFTTSIESLSVTELRNQIVALYPSNKTDISRFKPGQNAALVALQDFISCRLKDYAAGRNDPLANQQSELSPYLHFGHLASLTVARMVHTALQADSTLQADADALLEELLVRKELSDNWCYYNPDYMRIVGAPQWAQKTLAKHGDDHREFIYTRKQFEEAETHDPAWNAAQKQLRQEGKIHGYMRMYWAKKVLEWSPSAEDALATLVYLNDFYHLDGYDPNGYVGIMWSIAGVHDRPWGERPVYGVIRSMVFNGLKRKFDIQAYIDRFAA